MSRSPEQHLTAAEFEYLLRGTPDSSAEFRGRVAHLRTCETCQATERLLQIDKALHALALPSPSPCTRECPPDSVWTEVAAGLTIGDAATALLQHAAECDHCGPLLRSESSLFAREPSPEEKQVLSGLRLNASDERRTLSRKIITRHYVRMPWLYAAVAAMLTMIALPLWMKRRSSIEELPLRAYAEMRTVELRFAGAQYAPLQQTRGSSIERSPTWLEAEAILVRISSAARQNPEILQAKARLDLLAWRFEPALQTLNRAIAVRPDEPTLLVDLATAHYERAEAQSRDSDFGIAIELLGQALDRAENSVALFNRAIVFERMGLVRQSITDWQRYLKHDPRSPWASEAQAHLDVLLKKKLPASNRFEN